MPGRYSTCTCKYLLSEIISSFYKSSVWSARFADPPLDESSSCLPVNLLSEAFVLLSFQPSKPMSCYFLTRRYIRLSLSIQLAQFHSNRRNIRGTKRSRSLVSDISYCSAIVYRVAARLAKSKRKRESARCLYIEETQGSWEARVETVEGAWFVDQNSELLLQTGRAYARANELVKVNEHRRSFTLSDAAPVTAKKTNPRSFRKNKRRGRKSR